MRLSFHQRILLILICLGAIPTAAAIVGWGLTIRAATPAAGPREALDEVGATGRALLRTLDTTDLSRVERDALAGRTQPLLREIAHQVLFDWAFHRLTRPSLAAEAAARTPPLPRRPA